MADSLALDSLKRSIARVDCGFAPVAACDLATGQGEVDSALCGGLAQGRLHELYASSVDDAPCAAGFAAMLALRARIGNQSEGATGTGALLWLRTEAAERAMGRLYMPGLAELGGDPGALILALLPDDRALLRTAADAAACTGLGALVVECWGKAPLLTLTASRRLALAAEKSGVTMFLLRVDAEPSPSAAATRWAISAAPSAALAPDAPGHVTIAAELLRRRAGPAGMRWQMEWNRDERAFRQPALSGPALSGAVAALAGHRTTDPHRPDLRRSA